MKYLMLVKNKSYFLGPKYAAHLPSAVGLLLLRPRITRAASRMMVFPRQVDMAFSLENFSALFGGFLAINLPTAIDATPDSRLRLDRSAAKLKSDSRLQLTFCRANYSWVAQHHYTGRNCGKLRVPVTSTGDKRFCDHEILFYMFKHGKLFWEYVQLILHHCVHNYLKVYFILFYVLL